MKRYLYPYLPMYLTCILAFVILASSADCAITTIAENIPVKRSVTFVIDAGHGGEDGGAISCSGVLESGINLQIALRLEDLLHLLGYDTVMIRRTDISVYTAGSSIAAKKMSDLKERVRIVNETDNAILVSIHQNTYSDNRYSGAQVFYNDIPGSKELASELQKNFLSSVNPGSNRQCKQSDGIYLMQHILQPGILIECGFLSHPEEEAKLRTGEYQKKLCAVIAVTLAQSVN